MPKPVIAVDIDEVLAHFNRALAAWHNENYGSRHTEEDYVTNYWSEIWGVSHKEAERRAEELHQAGVHATLTPMRDARASLERLSLSYTLVVVTVRRKSVIPLTIDWLAKYYPGIFNDVRFVPFWESSFQATKATICQELGASYLIDDMLNHCQDATESGIESLLFGEYSWNTSQGMLPNGVTRVKNWREVENYFAHV